MKPNVTKTVTIKNGMVEVERPKSMLGAGFGPARLKESRDFKRFAAPGVGEKAPRNRGIAAPRVATPGHPSVTKSVTTPHRLNPLLFSFGETMEGKA